MIRTVQYGCAQKLAVVNISDNILSVWIVAYFSHSVWKDIEARSDRLVGLLEEEVEGGQVELRQLREDRREARALPEEFGEQNLCDHDIKAGFRKRGSEKRKKKGCSARPSAMFAPCSDQLECPGSDRRHRIFVSQLAAILQKLIAVLVSCLLHSSVILLPPKPTPFADPIVRVELASATTALAGLEEEEEGTTALRLCRATEARPRNKARHSCIRRASGEEVESPQI